MREETIAFFCVTVSIYDSSPLKLSPSSPKRRKETLNWEQCIICQCSNAESVICIRDVGKDSFVRSMEIRRDAVYSRILQEMFTMDNFISCI
jgi:hypothetical protein